MANESVELQVLNSAYNRRIHTFAIVNKTHFDVEKFLNDAFFLYQSEVLQTLETHNMVKTMAILIAIFEKKLPSIPENVQPHNDIDENAPNQSNASEQTIKQTLYFTTPNTIVDMGSDLREHFKKNIIEEILKCVENTATRGSGFTLSQIVKLDVQICSYEPLRGSSYIETPKKIQNKKAIVNVKNTFDNMCFKWAILSALYPVSRNPQRVQHYWKYEKTLNFNGIDFPVRLNQIDKFTSQNDEISINVYYFDEEDERVYPLRVSTDIKKHHIHLLLTFGHIRIRSYTGTTANKIKSLLEDEQTQLHYCWIKNLSRLVSSQLSKHDHEKHICDRCLNFFDTNEKLIRHLKNCTSEYQIEMPDEDAKWLEFKHHDYQLKAPFIIYADTEAFLKQLDENEKKRVFNEECKTTAYQEHHMYSVGYYFKCEFDNSKSFYASSGNRHDCIEWFIQELQTISQYAANMLATNKPMQLTIDEERLCKDPNVKCSICDRPFEENETRARDHCHFTGKFRGITHPSCNLNYKETRNIPIVMHNLSGYDAHLLIKK